MNRAARLSPALTLMQSTRVQEPIMGAINNRMALLMSGGIGDFLHYIVRFSAFLEQHAIAPEHLMVYVESTQPRQVESLFRFCLPEVNCHFVPPSLHWTKSNPLLNVDRPRDRVNRPARQYVLGHSPTLIEDWFLPFLCSHYAVDTTRLNFLRDSLAEGDGQTVLVSARDKGFLWWPSQESSALLRGLIPQQYRVIYSGTTDERLPWLDEFITAPSVLEALRISCRAALFVGTDTGLATGRELLGMPNVYCINEYWYEELMVKYGYWTEQLRNTSRSRFAFNKSDLQAALTSFFAGQKSAS